MNKSFNNIPYQSTEFKPIKARMPLIDEVSWILEKHYNFRSIPPYTTDHGHSLYRVEFDDRFLSFIEEAFDITQSLFYRMKFLSDFINVISKNKPFKYSEEIVIGKTSDIVLVLFGDVFSIHIRKDDKIDDFSIKFFDINIPFNPIEQKFDYEDYFNNRKLEIHRLAVLKGFTKFSHITKILDGSMTNRLYSVLDNNEVKILSKSECADIIQKRPNFGAYYIFDLSEINFFLPNILNKKSHRELNTLLSLILFEGQLDNSSVDSTHKFIEFEVTRTDSKFYSAYELYKFMFTRDIGHTVKNHLSITTENTVFEYYGPEHFDGYGERTVKGYEAIYDLIMNRILDKIAHKLEIEKKEINNKSILLYSMLSI